MEEFEDKLEWTKPWRNMVRVALIIGFMCGIAIGILTMYILNLIGWY